MWGTTTTTRVYHNTRRIALRFIYISFRPIESQCEMASRSSSIQPSCGKRIKAGMVEPTCKNFAFFFPCTPAILFFQVSFLIQSRKYLHSWIILEREKRAQSGSGIQSCLGTALHRRASGRIDAAEPRAARYRDDVRAIYRFTCVVWVYTPPPQNYTLAGGKILPLRDFILAISAAEACTDGIREASTLSLALCLPNLNENSPGAHCPFSL